MAQYHKILDDIIEQALYEHFEKRSKEKKTEKKPRESKGLGFFEGLVVAYVAQILYGPLTKLLEIYLQTHGVH